MFIVPVDAGSRTEKGSAPGKLAVRANFHQMCFLQVYDRANFELIFIKFELIFFKSGLVLLKRF